MISSFVAMQFRWRAVAVAVSRLVNVIRLSIALRMAARQIQQPPGILQSSSSPHDCRVRCLPCGLRARRKEPGLAICQAVREAMMNLTWKMTHNEHLLFLIRFVTKKWLLKCRDSASSSQACFFGVLVSWASIFVLAFLRSTSRSLIIDLSLDHVRKCKTWWKSG